ncbi:MAG: ABC transporter substrate-binding protein [Bacillota bacterium]
MDKDVTAARHLIENKGVSAIVGYWGSSLPSLANVMTPQKIIFIGTKPVNYNPQTMPYVAFSHTDEQIIVPQMTSILKYFKNVKVLGISTGQGGEENMAVGLEAVKEKLMPQFGITKIVKESYPPATSDFTQHVEKMNQQGVDTIYSWGFPSQEAAIEKSIYEMGLKDKMRFAGAGTLVDPKEYINVAGYEATQGNLHGYQAPWEMKETKVAPAVLEMTNRIRQAYQEKYNKEMLYAGAFDYLIGGMVLYFEALKKAGTTDPDAVMQAIEGGTFDLFIGTYTLSGKQTYGRNVFVGTTGGMGAIQGEKPVLVAESPLTTIP